MCERYLTFFCVRSHVCVKIIIRVIVEFVMPISLIRLADRLEGWKLVSSDGGAWGVARISSCGEMHRSTFT